MFPTSNFDVFSRNPAVFRQKRLEGLETAKLDKKTPRRWKTAGREAYSFSRRALLSRTSWFSSSIKLDTSVNCRYTDAKRT